MANSFGHLFRITTFGESHGGSVGVVIDGCPPGIHIDKDSIQHFLNRRRPGQSALSSPRKESDEVEILSGLEDNISLGTPIALSIKNQDAKQEHYKDVQSVFRPSHADFTTFAKYGIKAKSGGGRASARETIGRVAGGGVAEQIIAKLAPNLKITAWVQAVKNIEARAFDPSQLTRTELDSHPLRCPDPIAREEMTNLILSAKKSGDSVGGIISCYISGCPIGLGEPVFDKLEADLAKAMLSLPASRGFEIGLGFAATQLFGSEHNDAFTVTDGKITTKTNHSGGIQGGISNGEPIFFRVAFKPVATIFKEQETVTTGGEKIIFKPKAGRHDPCVLPRAVPMVEAMTALVVCDHLLRHNAIRSLITSEKS